MADPTLIRSAALLLPLFGLWAAWVWRPRGRPGLAAALLGIAWNVPALMAVHLLAGIFGWWGFDADGGLFLGFPVDLWLGWAVLWGPLPALAFADRPMVWAIGGALTVDLLLMPAAEPVVRLGEGWLVGEAVALLVCLVPAQLLARWTLQDARLGARVLLQVVCFTALTLGLLPAIVLAETDGAYGLAPNWSPTVLGLFAQVMAMPAIVGLSAVQEFAQRGRGTPIPFDPPRRLVTSGPYAYLANPMQAAMCLLLLGVGLLLGSAWLAGAALVAAAYGTGLAGWDERGDMRRRFGEPWARYRRHVRSWRPRWTPYVDARPVATLYVAEGCDPCSDVRQWLERQRPVGLSLEAAEDHPTRDLSRLTYDPGDGTGDEDGVAALGRALEHVNLGWAFVGWSLRLPLLQTLLQTLVDGLGGEPRRVPRRAAGGTADT